MEWTKCSDRLPTSKEVSHGDRLVILVNKIPQICQVVERETMSIVQNNFLIVIDVGNNFLFAIDVGFVQDNRYASPTHWISLPELPKD